MTCRTRGVLTVSASVLLPFLVLMLVWLLATCAPEPLPAQQAPAADVVRLPWGAGTVRVIPVAGVPCAVLLTTGGEGDIDCDWPQQRQLERSP